MHCVISWILLASTFRHFFFLCSTRLDKFLSVFLIKSISDCLSASSVSHSFSIWNHKNTNIVIKIVLEWVELALKNIYICYPDKSLLIWKRKQDSWNLVTTASFFSFWTLRDTISWSVYFTFSAGLSEHTGRKGKRARVASGLIVKPPLLSTFQRSLRATLLFHSKWTLHHTQKRYLYPKNSDFVTIC